MGDTSPVFPTKLRPCKQSSLWSRLQTTLPKLHGTPPSEYTQYWKFFRRSRFLSNLRLPWKNRVAWHFSQYWIYFLHSGFLTTCACPENRDSPENFHCIEYIFYHSGFLSNFVLALNRVGLEFFTALNIPFTFRSFEQLACVCPEKQRVLWIHSTDYTFLIIQDF